MTLVGLTKWLGYQCFWRRVTDAVTLTPLQSNTVQCKRINIQRIAALSICCRFWGLIKRFIITISVYITTVGRVNEKGLGSGSDAWPVRIGNFTYFIELLRSFLTIVSFTIVKDYGLRLYLNWKTDVKFSLITIPATNSYSSILLIVWLVGQNAWIFSE